MALAKQELLGEFNKLLSTMVSETDTMLALNFPFASIKKGKDKFNKSLMDLYTSHEDMDLSMYSILLALDDYYDFTELMSILDDNIKNLVRNEAEILKNRGLL